MLCILRTLPPAALRPHALALTGRLTDRSWEVRRAAIDTVVAVADSGGARGDVPGDASGGGFAAALSRVVETDEHECCRLAALASLAAREGERVGVCVRRGGSHVTTLQLSTAGVRTVGALADAVSAALEEQQV